MREDLPRRGFLRNLARLPLIGGGVTLLGNPTAAAVPVTTALLAEYETWLSLEAMKLARELRPGRTLGNLTTFYTAAHGWHDADPGTPSERAAVVLAAIGCEWREKG